MNIIKTSSFEEMEDVSNQCGWDCRYTQIDHGKFEGELVELSGDSKWISHEKYSLPIHIQGSTPQDYLSIAINTSTLPGRYNGHALLSNEGVIVSPGSQIDYIGNKNSETGVLYIAQKEFEQFLETLDKLSLSRNKINQKFDFGNGENGSLRFKKFFREVLSTSGPQYKYKPKLVNIKLDQMTGEIFESIAVQLEERTEGKSHFINYWAQKGVKKS